jgi:Dyp-type peroxidase family
MSAVESFAAGVLPDEVIRDQHSDAELIFVTLENELAPDVLETFLKDLSTAVRDLASGEGDEHVATACVGFGHRFFSRVAVTPSGITAPEPTQGAPLDVDLVIYVMCRAEWRLADFRRQLAQFGDPVVSAVAVQRGYQRPDGRELGGFLDGLRNAKLDRESVVFVERDLDPTEPAAAEGGTYMVTMRIVQDLLAWNALSETDQEAVIGRRKADGSRLDTPLGTPISDEGEIAPGQGCPMNSHVAKAGPRGPHRDHVQIFRRGVPFIDLTATGGVEAGLQFVSFQASMDQFLTVADEWIENVDFPDAGTGRDALFGRGFATVTNFGLFFVPAPAEFLGAQFLRGDVANDRCLGRVAIRKRLQDASGNPIRGELGGFAFQLFDAAGVAVAEPFVTDSTGRAVSAAVAMDAAYVVREVASRPGFDATPEQTVTLDKKRVRLDFVNRASAATPNPGYR